MQAILEKAIELYRRQRCLEESNRAFEALRANMEIWKTEQAEREVGNPTRGHEPAGVRPGLVVSVDPFNHGPAGPVVLLPLTSVAIGL